MLDVGTGSGAIALAIADEHPGAIVTGVDASADALALAAENVSAPGSRSSSAERDLFDGLPHGPWDLVVSNPPYVDAADLPELAARGSRLGAPRGTDRGGRGRGGRARGRSGAPGAAPRSRSRWGQDRPQHVARLLEELGLVEVRVTPDLSGIDRVVEGRMA